MKELITDIRESKMMNQAEFAELLGISQGMLSMLEAGERLPGRKTIKSLVTIANPDQRTAILNALVDDKQGHQ
ncbi:MAG: helix-turn-helix transcriptional regulator [Anaerolineae bacterium]